MAGGTLTATKDGGKTVLTDAKGDKATITKADEQYSNGVVHHVDAVLMPREGRGAACQASRLKVALQSATGTGEAARYNGPSRVG